MKEKFCNALSYISLIITAFYGVSNLIAVVLLNIYTGEEISGITERVLGLDVFTWHIYGIFAIATFLMKISLSSKKMLDTNAILHLVFMALSFFGIVYLFTNCF